MKGKPLLSMAGGALVSEMLLPEGEWWGKFLLRMKFLLVLIIPLKAGRLLFFEPGRGANKPWMDRVCAGVEPWALAKLRAETGTEVIIHLWETFFVQLLILNEGCVLSAPLCLG